MDDPADDAPLLVAAPRHLKRRAFHEEVPDTLLVPGVEPLPAVPARETVAKRAASVDLDAREAAYRRKRLVALICVLMVALSVPALMVALLLAG